jgi:hypothetical protein
MLLLLLLLLPSLYCFCSNDCFHTSADPTGETGRPGLEPRSSDGDSTYHQGGRFGSHNEPYQGGKTAWSPASPFLDRHLAAVEHRTLPALSPPLYASQYLYDGGSGTQRMAWHKAVQDPQVHVEALQDAFSSMKRQLLDQDVMISHLLAALHSSRSLCVSSTSAPSLDPRMGTHESHTRVSPTAAECIERQETPKAQPACQCHLQTGKEWSLSKVPPLARKTPSPLCVTSSIAHAAWCGS